MSADGAPPPASPARTKSQRQLTPGRMFVYRLAVWLAALILEVLWRTSRLEIIGGDKLQVLLKEQGSFIPVFWHQHLLMCARYICSNKIPGIKPGFMISPSVDGQAPTMLAQLYGAHVVRGSGSYTGVRAVRGVHNAIVKESISPVITPDGPRGPRFKVKGGAIFTGQITGKAVVPIAFAASPAKLLRTWDKFVIPLPFAKLRIAIGEPYYPPKRMTEEEMEAAQKELERRLHETFKLAKDAL